MKTMYYADKTEKNGRSKHCKRFLFLCFFAYMISYVGKYAYSANIQNIILDFQITKAQAGYASTAFFVCYGTGQLINGILCGVFDSRKLVTTSLIASAFLSGCMFFCNNLYAMTAIWGLNGLILSTLWANIVNLAFSLKEERYAKLAPVVLSMTVPVGTIIAYGVSTILTYFAIWRVYYLFAAAVLFGGGVYFAFALQMTRRALAEDAPAPKGESHKDAAVSSEPEDKSVVQMPFFRCIGREFLPLFILLVLDALIKDGITGWMPPYLSETYALPSYFSVLLTLGISLLGIAAAILAKIMVEKTGSVYRSTVLSLFPMLLFLGILTLFSSLHLILSVIMFAIMEMLAHVVLSLLTSIYPMLRKKQINSGRLAGILNGFAYVGSALSSTVLGSIIDRFAWKGFTLVLWIGALTAMLCACIGEALQQSSKKR